ncbi:MAG: SEC-C domain-containing protein, partial [Burkholderiaceae bacterium]|nr:SEC-C domain-containing protein [Burkholderiaceae bacterium]
LDYLRQGIHLRGYAQKNPKQEYKREAFELFSLMQDKVRNDVTRVLLTVRIQAEEESPPVEQAPAPAYSNVQYTHADFGEAASAAPDAGVDELALALQQRPDADEAPAQQPVRRFGQKIGRNDPCPCGSGKKYKQCHGRLG